MRNVVLGCLFALALVAAPASAQQLKLPAPSPAAKVMQEVGVTDITVEYSSPGAKGRKIWGDLVPWDKPWRTGANAATKITFSRDVDFGGKPVPAGTYAIVTLPTAKGWTVILSKELGLFAGKAYDPKDDVVRVPATTAEISPRERLTFFFSNTTEDSTSLDFEWEKLRVSVPIKVDTGNHVKANIQSTLGGSWRTHASAARYVSENLKDHDTALKYVDTSIAIQSTWYNQWIRATILAAKGNYAEARKAAQASFELGDKDPNFFFREDVTKALAEWKNKK